MAGEGPVGLIVCPSRELARQTHEVIMGYIQSLKQDGFPELRALLAMGGIDMREQVCAHSEVSLLREKDDHTPSVWCLDACLLASLQAVALQPEAVLLCNHHMHVQLDANHMPAVSCNPCRFC